MLTRVDTDGVRRRHALSDLLAAYGVELRRSGRALAGRCPFHPDGGRPNLHVYPDTQSWYCYRCGIGGDVIDLVMRAHGLDFRAAVARLEGGPVVQLRPIGQHCQSDLPVQPQCCDRDPAAGACLAAAVELYHRRLLATPAALAYLRRRGIVPATVRRCRLGYAAGTDLVPGLRRRGLPLDTAQRLGLLFRDGRERMTGRIVVPEIRPDGPCWLIGRRLAGGECGPKYLALPGPRPLLGWEDAAAGPAAVLTEGVFDWLTLVQWGIPAIGLGGTHVRPALLRALSARFRTLVLALDADPAGRAATAALADALGPGARPVQLPAGVNDVADLARRPDGRVAFLEALRAVTAPPSSARAA